MPKNKKKFWAKLDVVVWEAVRRAVSQAFDAEKLRNTPEEFQAKHDPMLVNHLSGWGPYDSPSVQVDDNEIVTTGGERIPVDRLTSIISGAFFNASKVYAWMQEERQTGEDNPGRRPSEAAAFNYQVRVRDGLGSLRALLLDEEYVGEEAPQTVEPLHPHPTSEEGEPDVNAKHELAVMKLATSYMYLKDLRSKLALEEGNTPPAYKVGEWREQIDVIMEIVKEGSDPDVGE